MSSRRADALRLFGACVLSALTALGAAPRRAAAAGEALAAGEVRGAGSARVVGGNQVSARRRALAQARRDAVVKAVLAQLGAEAVTRLAGKLGSIYARYRSYARSYRVIAESSAAGTFSVEVAVKLASARLARDLARLEPGARQGSAKGRPTLALWVQADGKLAAALQAKARELIASEGFATQPVSGAARSDAARAAQAAKLPVLLAVRVRCVVVPPVRGLMRAAARATARARVAPLAVGAAEIAAASGKRVAVAGADGTSGSGAAAKTCAEAAAGALAAALGPLRRAMGSRWPRFGGSGGVTLRVKGIPRFADYAAMCVALRRSVAAVSSCAPLRLARSEALFSLRGSSPDAKQLAGALARAALSSGARLALVGVAGGQVTMSWQSSGAAP